MKQKHANINAFIYDDVAHISFDCIGVKNCKFVLCEIMPPRENDECCYKRYACCCPAAKMAALKELQKTINKEIKELEENEE